MAKSGKHKKLRRKEKAKTQLTGVKRLAKAQNAFEPKLTSKKIFLKEQLKDCEDASITLTKRKQSLIDIFGKLNHHNKNIKKEALNGLKELITIDAEILLTNLSDILQKVFFLTSDIESSVRKENFKLAESLFERIQEEQIEPFWNIVVNHLKCTWTNLDSRIRMSTIPFFTLIISHFPNLVWNTRNILLPNILKLISNSTSKPNSNEKLQIKIDISNSKSDSLQDRIGILNLIDKCLELQIQNFHSEVPKDEISFIDYITRKVGIYYLFGYESEKNDFEHMKDADKDLESENKIIWYEFIENCFQIIIQTWIEVGPNVTSNKTVQESHKRGLANLNKNTIEVLQCIVNVIVHLIIEDSNATTTASVKSKSQNVDHSVFKRSLRKNHGEELKKYLFKWLPFYSAHDNQKEDILTINLRLFYIAAELQIFDQKLFSVYQNYLNDILDRSTTDKNSSLNILILNTLNSIHLSISSNIDNTVSKFILSSLKSKDAEPIFEYLMRILSLKTEKGSLNLKNVQWDLIVSAILTGAENFQNEIIAILTLISIRKLTNMKELLQNKDVIHKFKDFLNNDSIECWDKVLYLYHYNGAIQIFETNFVKSNTNTPQDIISTMKACTSIC